MKATELRLNNLVYFEFDFKLQIHLIIPKDLRLMQKVEQMFKEESELYRPIPLTEEMLLKCGFVKVKNKDKEDLREYVGRTVQKAKYAIFDTDIFITKVDKRGLLWRNIECDFMVLFYHKSIPIKYLHQLQNLYFALTGQELEINL